MSAVAIALFASLGVNGALLLALLAANESHRALKKRLEIVRIERDAAQARLNRMARR